MSGEMDFPPFRDALLFSLDDGDQQLMPVNAREAGRIRGAGRMARVDSDAEFPEPGEARRFTKVLSVEGSSECLEIRYRRSRWSKVDYEGSDEVRSRLTDGIIMVSGERAGRIQFTEFRLGAFVTRHEFWRTMDDASAAKSALAEVINGAWSDPTDVTDFGDIVEFNRVWLRLSVTGRGRLGAVCEIMLKELFSSRALLILKAFPLEYEGAVTSDNELAFSRRRIAMMRRYAGMLGVEPLPGSSGQEGWMYSVPSRLADVIEPPSVLELLECDEE